MSKVTIMFENALKVFKELTDNHKNPLHVGETMACWTYLAFVGNIISIEEIALNTVSDQKLKGFFEEALNIANSHKRLLSEFMEKEGVSLPRIPESKPKSDPDSIPLGAKFTDDELINTVNINFVVAADMCAASASQSLRTDVGLMFLKFQAEKISLGFKAKELMAKKGWLKIPPYFQPPGLPKQ